MAEALIADYELLTLRIAMDLSADFPQVSLRLQAGLQPPRGAEVESTFMADWKCSAESIGLPERLDRSGTLYTGYQFHFPVDVLAERPGERVAIEVETGKSDITANLTKLRGKGFDRIILVATSPAAVSACHKALDHLDQASPAELLTWLDF